MAKLPEFVAHMQTLNSHWVAHGSVLEPVFFTLHTLSFDSIIRKHSIRFHFYADDTQFYLLDQPDETNHLVKLQTCLRLYKMTDYCSFKLFSLTVSDLQYVYSQILYFKCCIWLQFNFHMVPFSIMWLPNCLLKTADSCYCNWRWWER